mgnify:CR=1 FL=1
MFFYFATAMMISYLLGSLSFSIIISKNFNQKKDIRSLGSNNAGFSNMLRSFGFLPALFTFIGDFSKGVLAICISNFMFENFNIFIKNKMFFLLLSCFFCCLGHMWPCFFKFNGGKAILTTWACNFLIDFKISLGLIIIFLIILILSKIISLSSICAAVAYPILVFIFEKNTCKYAFLVALILSILIIFKHRTNIKRLIRNEEKSIKICKK